MTFPIPPEWRRDTAEFRRDEVKRKNSPSSFFYAQGRALVLAAGYFTDSRLTPGARLGAARKHRHRIHLALFGQLMASFEYMLKDFCAQAIDATDAFDPKVKEQKWLDIDLDRVLAQRVVQTSVGALLIHPTLGWHDPERVNTRFSSLFGYEVIRDHEVATLSRLWIIRHTVAHNAGFVTAPDATRMGSPPLAECVVALDYDFIAAPICATGHHRGDRHGTRNVFAVDRVLRRDARRIE